MDNLTIPQFIDLLKTAEITPSSEAVETVWPEHDDEPHMIWGWICNKLVADGFSVAYQNSYEHQQGKPSTVTTSNDVPDLWIIDRQDFVVVDDDGDEISNSDLYEIISENTAIESLDLSVLGDDESECVDNNGETITVLRDNDLDIKFSGGPIGYASNSDNNCRSDYSGQVGRWSEISLYRTTGGKYICERIDYTRWVGEKTGYAGAVCETDEQVVEFFGVGELAKQLYADAGIDCAVSIA